MSRFSTSNKSHKEIKDADGKISLNELDTFFDGKSTLNDISNEKITIYVNVDEGGSQGKSSKVLKTEIDCDGELIRHESLMTEMNQDEDEDDDENILLLKTLIEDDNPDITTDGCLLDNLSDGIKSPHSKKVEQEVF